ncbi:MAG TPA: hypothetical protein VKU79_06835, partial [Thermoplasmataceae archaeon]|nr:hypothetical protein [Thermoplasmataceae archaeon]
IWTGTDVFLGLIFSQVLRNIKPAMQRDVMQRLLPMTMFFIPTATILTIAVGYFLASAERIFSLESTIFMAIVTIGLVLAVITFAIIFPSSLRIASLIRQEKAADNEVSRFIHRISLGCLSQLFFQVVMISLMAYLVVYQ